MRLTEKKREYVSNIVFDDFSLQEINFDEGMTGEMKEIVKRSQINNAITKLGQLEDIEDELDIDLITFFKIYNADKVYIKGKKYYWKIKHYNRHSISVGTNKIICLSFKDYGKTWSLTKEELL